MISQPHKSLYQELVAQALKEDIGHGDITTELTVPSEISGSAIIKTKEPAVVAGLFVVEEVFHQVDPSLEIIPKVAESDFINPDDIICQISGSLVSILLAERVALNFIQRMMGIATATRTYVAAVEGLNCHIVETRKTTPGLRILEKYAVRAGGGFNHRYNLSDGILIKDNHIAAVGSIEAAVTQAKQNKSHTLLIEVEVENLDDLKTALKAGADAILLDNMSIDQLKQAVSYTKKEYPDVMLEASGNITLKNIREVAETGVDIISIGALTHTIKAVDLSLEIVG